MSIPLFKEAMRQQIAAEQALQTMLNDLLPPEGRREREWTVYWVREGEHDNEFQAMLTPPQGCHSLHYATLVNLLAVKEAVSADWISASQVGDALRYHVTWKRQP
jgi:hypothetical protein